MQKKKALFLCPRVYKSHVLDDLEKIELPSSYFNDHNAGRLIGLMTLGSQKLFV